jgi:2-oxoglutarate/2-oxoacid ferredoxin oxidoreductase subunit alpha
MTRQVIKIAGESGGGIESTGNIVMKALKKLGYFIYAEREFPSLIKGGRANIQINFAKQEIRSLSTKIDTAIALDREGVLDSLETLKIGGLLIHGFDRWPKVIKDLPQIALDKQINVIMIPAREIALNCGGTNLMVNTVLLGFLWQKLDLDYSFLEAEIREQFGKKIDLIDTNLLCAKTGFNYQIS